MAVTLIKFKTSTSDPYDGAASPGLPAEFTASINPESISHSRTINVNQENNANAYFDVYQFKGYGKETVSLQLILDGTGYATTTKITVRDQLDSLLKAVYDFVGSSHRSHFVQIAYGDTLSNKWWVCESLDVNYTLFDSTGSPLIAEVDLSFVIHRNKKNQSAAEPAFSPDMTHIFTFKDGDSLPAMCKNIYDSVDYYMQIAEINQLSNFREIPTGTKLFFPPLLNKD